MLFYTLYRSNILKTLPDKYRMIILMLITLCVCGMFILYTCISGGSPYACYRKYIYIGLIFEMLSMLKAMFFHKEEEIKKPDVDMKELPKFDPTLEQDQPSSMNIEDLQNMDKEQSNNEVQNSEIEPTKLQKTQKNSESFNYMQQPDPSIEVPIYQSRYQNSPSVEIPLYTRQKIREESESSSQNNLPQNLPVD